MFARCANTAEYYISLWKQGYALRMCVYACVQMCAEPAGSASDRYTSDVHGVGWCRADVAGVFLFHVYVDIRTCEFSGIPLLALGVLDDVSPRADVGPISNPMLCFIALDWFRPDVGPGGLAIRDIVMQLSSQAMGNYFPNA